MKHPALRYHGGKFRLAPWVLSHFPPHDIYVEPFGGAAGVLLQKPRSKAEVYNDLDGDIVNLFLVLRDPALADRLVDACRMTPYARKEFDLAFTACEDPVERARRTTMRAMMGFGSAGATKGHTGMRIDSDRLYGHAAHLWAKYPDSLAAVTARMRGVFIENRPALDVVQQHDGPATLIYCDPPYVHSTRDPRVSNRGDSGGYYRHEMSDDDHVALLDGLKRARGMVIVSGYHSALYDVQLVGWERHETQSRMSAGRGTDMRTEVLWLNPACSAALRRPRSQSDLLMG